QLCSTTRRVMKHKIAEAKIRHFFSREKDFLELRRGLSVRRDFVIHIEGPPSAFAGKIAGYHSRTEELFVDRCITLHKHGRLDLTSPFDGKIKLAIMVDKGDRWTKVVGLILNATGRQLSFRNCSLLCIYDGPDNYEHLEKFAKPVRTNPRYANDRKNK
ncbi:hypothetical protein PMAYCL1PPCAC_18257, partial [Pristionchus mayeri]